MIKGYDNLTQEHKDLFDAFLPNFKRYGNFTPISIYCVEEVEYSIEKGENFYNIATTTEIINQDGTRSVLISIVDDEYPNYVEEADDVSRKRFLRFDYIGNHGPEWQHIISPTEWY